MLIMTEKITWYHIKADTSTKRFLLTPTKLPSKQNSSMNIDKNSPPKLYKLLFSCSSSELIITNEAEEIGT